MTNNKKTVIKTEYKDTDSIYEMRQDNKYNTIIEVYKNNKIVLVTSISEIIETVNEKREGKMLKRAFLQRGLK